MEEGYDTPVKEEGGKRHSPRKKAQNLPSEERLKTTINRNRLQVSQEGEVSTTQASVTQAAGWGWEGGGRRWCWGF